MRYPALAAFLALSACASAPPIGERILMARASLNNQFDSQTGNVVCQNALSLREIHELGIEPLRGRKLLLRIRLLMRPEGLFAAGLDESLPELPVLTNVIRKFQGGDGGEGYAFNVRTLANGSAYIVTAALHAENIEIFDLPYCRPLRSPPSAYE